jgi:predicted RNase H-like HicB family nuclease
MMAGPVHNYEIIIFWSVEDAAFVADVPELPGWMAHGETYEKALANVREAMDLWIQTARELGRRVPTPKGQRLVFA